MRRKTALQKQISQSQRRQRLVALGFVAPLFFFLVFAFALPLGGMLWRAIDDRVVANAFPNTVEALSSWSGQSLPDENVYRAFAGDLKDAQSNETLALAARRLNYDIGGFRAALFSTARRLPPADVTSYKDSLIAANAVWGDVAYWGAIRNAHGPVSPFFLLSAIDLGTSPEGSIVARPVGERIFFGIFLRTFTMALTVTLACLLLGFPLSYLLATLPDKFAFPMLVCVLIPFWTSLLVRTAAWVVLLQSNGVINDMLRAIGLIDQPLTLIYNRIGVNLAMTHVLLPFLVLPLYSVMKGISPNYMRASASLGAAPLRSFIKVYLPQCRPGIAAGCLLVFVVALGFYITPALVGGPGDQMVSYYIAFYTNTSANWGLACALGAWLLVFTFVLYAASNRVLNLTSSLSS